MNYRYRVDNEDVIVSQEENEIIKSAIKAGGSVIYLRDDTLAINASFIRYIKETEQPTDEQERKRDDVLKLEGKKWVEPSDEEAENRQKILNSYRTSGNGFSQVGSKGDMKKCEGCEEEHFIPADRTLCLPCLMKKTRESTAEKK